MAEQVQEFDAEDARPPYFMAIGDALFCWNEIEQTLFLMFADLASITDTKLAAIIFHTVRFPDKLRMASELFEFRIKEPTCLSTWAALVRRMQTAEKKRNKLVHWTLIPYALDKQPVHAFENVVFTSSLFDPRNYTKKAKRGNLPLKNIFTVSDINAFAASFVAIRNELQKLQFDLARSGAWFDKSPIGRGAQKKKSRTPKDQTP